MNRTRLNVLVIDDNQDTAELMCEFFKSDGHQCHTAATRSEALETLDKNKLDFIFLEIEGPRLMGYELINDLENTEKIKNYNIVILTASDNISMYEIEELKKKGIKSFFKKPIKPNLALLELGLNKNYAQSSWSDDNGQV